MKYLIFICMFFSPKMFGQAVYSDYIKELKTISQDKDAEVFGLFKRKVKRATRDHFQDKVKADEISNIVMEYAEYGPSLDVIEQILAKLVGPKLAKFIIEMSALPEIEKHLTVIVFEWRGLMDPAGCPESLRKISYALAYIAAYAAITYYAPGPGKMVASLAGGIAVSALKIVYAFSDIDKRICAFFHKEELYVPVY